MPETEELEQPGAVAPADDGTGGAPAEPAAGEAGAGNEPPENPGVARLRQEFGDLRTTNARLQAQLAELQAARPEPADDPEDETRFNTEFLQNPRKHLKDIEDRAVKTAEQRASERYEGQRVDSFLESLPESKHPEFATRMAGILDEMGAGARPTLRQVTAARKLYQAEFGGTRAPGIPRTPPCGGKGAAGGGAADKPTYDDGSDEHFEAIRDAFGGPPGRKEWAQKEMARLKKDGKA